MANIKKITKELDLRAFQTGIFMWEANLLAPVSISAAKE